MKKLNDILNSNDNDNNDWLKLLITGAGGLGTGVAIPKIFEYVTNRKLKNYEQKIKDESALRIERSNVYADLLKNANKVDGLSILKKLFNEDEETNYADKHSATTLRELLQTWYYTQKGFLYMSSNTIQ